MIIKPVDRPLQDEKTKPENIQYPNEKWTVKTYMFAEKDGGMKLWFKQLKEMEAKGYEVAYLYKINAINEKLVTSPNRKNWVETIMYYVRVDYKQKV